MKRALAGCGVAALLLFVAASQTWATVDYGGGRERGAKAGAFVGTLGVFGLIALAGGVAVLATRRRARIPVGLALTASGATVAAQILAALRDLDTKAYDATLTAGIQILPAYPVDRTAWPYVALLGGALLAATGVLVTLRGPGWAAMSAKYDAPVGPPSDADVWSALDRGEDPTA